MQKFDISQRIHLKKGIYELNRDPNFNYQLNRVINWDGGRLEDVAPIAAKIKTSSEWKRELNALCVLAILENRTANAIA